MNKKRIAVIISTLLSTRYKVTIKGVELLSSDRSSLYLPNHPAEVDPQILISEIGKYDEPVPMISETYYNLPLINSFMKFLDAVPVADLEAGSRDVSVVENMRKAMLGALKNGKSVVLYPSGQLSNQAYEKIFNKQSAYRLVQELDDNTRVIGVRQQGLWGSVWSRAWWGKSPDFFKVFLLSGFYVLANLIFFVPKRKVEIEFVDISEEAKAKSKSLTRREFNEYLETFYNVNGEEGARFIRHFFFLPFSKKKIHKKVKGFVVKGKGLVFRSLPDA
ncbi:MAG: 1-acyl-sn-glycerol-3-phosphate acyltransferase [Bacteroidales bacterium]|nr:1-acyl-sn-glycerol-3-phosphate acyltransferase [Bacteroidales bacterium]